MIDKGFPKPALINWAANITADCALDRWDELVELPRSERDRILRRARWDHRDEAAARGTAAHGLILDLAHGKEVEPSDEMLGYVDAYLRFVDEWRPRELLIEAPVFSLEYGYAGTPDVVADLADGRRWLLDYKTGGKGIFPEFALQLAAYRYADLVLGPDGGWQPMPTVDAAGCVWIQDGVYELRPVDAGPETFVTFGHVQAIHDFAERDRDDVVGAALPPPLKEEP